MGTDDVVKKKKKGRIVVKNKCFLVLKSKEKKEKNK